MISLQPGLRALESVQSVFPGAILAGGYLRDVLCGRAPRDIDIFVPYMAMDLKRAIALGILRAERMTGAAEYMERTEVCDIWDLADCELPIQIIMLSPGWNPIERAKNHDFGICQVWMSGAAVEYTEAFVADVASNTFTLVACETEIEYRRSMRRWTRLQEKYREFTLVVPEEFRKFAGVAA